MNHELTPYDQTNVSALEATIETPPAPRLWWRRLIMLLLLLWTVNITWLAQFAGWSGELIGWTPESLNGPTWASLIQGGLLVTPLVIASWFLRMDRYRAITSMWLAAAILVLLLAPTRLWSSTRPQAVLLTQIMVISIYGWLFTRWIPIGPALDAALRQAQGAARQAQGAARQAQGAARQAQGAARQAQGVDWQGTADVVLTWKGVPLALVVGALWAYPWLVVGSLGSVMDLLLSLVLGFLMGWVANLLINRIWLQSLRADSRGLGRDGLTGGFVIGTTLLILTSGSSFNGVQILLMLTLSAAGWLLIAASDGATPKRAGYASGPGWLVGTVCAVILAFTDSDATLLQAMDGLLSHYFAATGTVVAAGLLLGLLTLMLRRPMIRAAGSSTVLLAGIALLLTGALIYHLSGQFGFHGDSLFVVMKGQADVSAAATMRDYDARRLFVYDTLVDHANESQADLWTSLERFGIDYTPYYLVNGLEVRGGLFVNLWLKSRADVDRVMPSPALRPLFRDQAPASGEASAPTEPRWNITNLGAERVWADFGVRGESIVIGQSDSGVQYDHPEVADSYRGASAGESGGNHDYSWFDPWSGSLEPHDISGHGTHTLASVLGNSVGIAPDAEWIGCANLHRNLGNPAFYLDCMQFMLAPFPINGNPLADGDPTRSAHVLNNSWGCPEDFEGCDPESLRPAVVALRSAGIFVVASAGNSGPDCSTITDSIAIYDEVFSVGAVNAQNDLALFSSVGPVVADGSGRVKPDILAPGVDVLSAYPNGTYEEASGTSMAGPHIVGVVALLWSANPGLIGNIDRTEQILVETAQPFNGTLDLMIPRETTEAMAGEDMPGFLSNVFPTDLPESACIREVDLAALPNNVAGFGIVDAYEAVKEALTNN